MAGWDRGMASVLGGRDVANAGRPLSRFAINPWRVAQVDGVGASLSRRIQPPGGVESLLISKSLWPGAERRGQDGSVPVRVVLVEVIIVDVAEEQPQ